MGLLTQLGHSHGLKLQGGLQASRCVVWMLLKVSKNNRESKSLSENDTVNKLPVRVDLLLCRYFIVSHYIAFCCDARARSICQIKAGIPKILTSKKFVPHPGGFHAHWYTL